MALLTLENLLALLTLTALEIVLGIDNIVMLAIVTGSLPRRKQPLGRRLGLTMAMMMRILLLLSISWVMSLKTALFTLAGFSFSARDLIMIAGGLFLFWKATSEIHDNLEGEEGEESAETTRRPTSLASAVLQITLLDIVFSLDSVITAIGMASEVKIMIAAIIIAVALMMVFAGRISHLIEKHPTLRILALSFLMLIGFVLVADGFHKHVEKGYIYFAMGFALLVEMLNIRMRRRLTKKPENSEP